MRSWQGGYASNLGGVPLDLSEEDAGYLMSSLEHHRWARALLRRLDGEARRRFSDSGWAYGDPTYMGGSPEQLYDAQLDSVLAALFPRLTGEVMFTVGEELAPGLILDAETGEPLAEPGEELSAIDYVVFAVFRGRVAHDVARLERGLALALPDQKVFRRRVDEPDDRHNAVLILDAQWGPDETIYDELFEGLTKAYEALREEEGRPLDNRHRGRRGRQTPEKARKRPGGQARGRGRGARRRRGRRGGAPRRRRPRA